MTACPSCHAPVRESEEYCEACGAELSPTVAATEGPSAQPPLSDAVVAEESTQETMPEACDLSGVATICATCGGEVVEDGYCNTCGARAPKLRDHFSEQPAAWVAAVCDRGLRHTRNEDAVALAADPEPGSRAVLVVCDGVSSSVDSDLASLAAARAARDVLASSHSIGILTGLSPIAAIIARLGLAADAASEAVLKVSMASKNGATPDSLLIPSPASCTFVAAVVEQNTLVVGSVGDSRAYWIPDVGAALALTLDDSFAQVQIAAGVPRQQAESGPQSHAITRWLGADAPDHKPTSATMTPAEPGWLLVCSDGLWNYCSAAQDLAELVRETSSTSPGASEPLALAEALIGWAKAQGGQDNISAALARIQPDRSANIQTDASHHLLVTTREEARDG
jgi:serine/threonine protein phosphatase PrpC